MATLMQNSHDDKLYRDESERLKNETKLVETCFDLENNLNKLYTTTSMYDSHKEMIGMDRLPNLQLSTYSNTNHHMNKKEETNKPSLNTNMRRPRNFTIESFTNSELVSSSVISTSNTADLSEDEQINYYEDENASQNENVMNHNHGTSPKKTRCLSNSSDGTLIVLPTNSTITETVNFNAMSLKSPVLQVKLKDLINIDADDEGEHHDKEDDEHENEDDEDNHNDSEDEEEEEDNQEDNDDDGDDEEDDENYENNLITIQYGGSNSEAHHDEEHNYEKILPKEDEVIGIRSPSPRKIKTNTSINNLITETKIDLGLAKLQSIPQHPESSLSIDTNVQNDLSDDEVKDYHAFEEDSHA